VALGKAIKTLSAKSAAPRFTSLGKLVKVGTSAYRP